MVEHLTRVASEMLGGLRSSPMLLAIILLNMIMVGAALWFLKALAAAQAARFDTLLKACMGKMS